MKKKYAAIRQPDEFYTSSKKAREEADRKSAGSPVPYIVVQVVPYGTEK